MKSSILYFVGQAEPSSLLRDYLIKTCDSLGHDVVQVSELNYWELSNLTRMESRIPFIISTREVQRRPEVLRTGVRIMQHFMAISFLEEPVHLPGILTACPTTFSLWGRECRNEEIKRAIKFIYENLDNPELCISDIASHVCLSHDRLNSRFKNWCGSSTWSVAEHLRMKEAEALLRTTRAKVAEIGHAVGYQEPSSFARAFKNFRAVSPADYRRQTCVKLSS
jgi:AraC-like DNA-binding protein